MLDSRNGHVTRLAVWLSRIFHPFAVSVIVLFLVQRLAGHSILEAAAWTLLAFTVVILPSLVFIAFRVRRGRYRDLDVSVRSDRHLLYGIACACFVAILVLLAWMQAPMIVQRTMLAAFVAVGVGAGFNRFVNKLSLHSLVMAGCSAVLFSVSFAAGAVLGILTLLVGWSRIHLVRHRASEVMWGWIVGAMCVALWFLF